MWRDRNTDVQTADELLEQIKIDKDISVNGKKGTGKDRNVKITQYPFSLPKGWVWTNLGVITSFIGSGVTPRGGRKVYLKEGIPFIRSQNVLRNKLNFKDLAYVSPVIHEKMRRTHIEGGETLLNITGASIGRAAQLPLTFSPANVNQHVCILRFFSVINTSFPVYWLNSPILQKILMEIQNGVTRQGLNYEQIRSFPIPLPPKKEQDVIVFKLEQLLNKEEEVKAIIELESKMESIKQSILSKAFRGELGTNDPTDDSALEVLKEALSCN